MLTTLLIFGCIAVTMLGASLVLVAVKISQTSSNAIFALTRQHERHAQQLDRLLDRLMSRDWEQYLVLRDTDAAEGGDFITPSTEDEDGGIVTPTPWGRLSRSFEVPASGTEEAAMVEEDFAEELQ